MRTVGLYLLYTAVALRGVVRFWDNPGRSALLIPLLAYGILLVLSLHLRDSFADPGHQAKPASHRTLIFTSYLILQTFWVMLLFRLRIGADFFALLFVPISLQAALYFRGRAGTLWIAFFCACMLIGLQGVEPEALFGLGMTVVYGGLCFLFGGYARQVHGAEAAHQENQRLLAELSAAHAELERYANQVEELAAEHERSRLARELHDSVTQTAFSMNLAVQSARLLLGGATGLLAAQLERLEQLAASAIGEIQSLASELGAGTAVQYDLVSALRRLAAEREQRDGLRVSLQVTGEQRLPEQAARNLCAIVQEALANVVKHSGVCEAAVRLALGPGRMTLEIQDRGKGFAIGKREQGGGHLGMAGMEERAREIGWSFCVESHPGAGTSIRVTRNSLEIPA